MRSSKTDRRHEQILEMLSGGKVITVSEFCDKFGCSTSTIRNDLAALEDQNLLVRVFGGAKLLPKTKLSLSTRTSAHQDWKREIAEYVVDNLIVPDSTIILDAGTTTCEVAKLLARRTIPLCVLTSSLLVSMELTDTPNIRLFSFGGYYDAARGGFYDDFIREYSKLLHADLFLMGVNGVSPDVGFSITYREEVPAKTAFMGIADRTVVLGDSSKLMRNAYRVIADLSAADMLITDAHAAPDAIQTLRDTGLTVVQAASKD